MAEAYQYGVGFMRATFQRVDRMKMNHADLTRRRAARQRALGHDHNADVLEGIARNIDGHSWQVCPRCGIPQPFRHAPCNPKARSRSTSHSGASGGGYGA